jgi:Uncharacterized protein involved in cation transport
MIFRHEDFWVFAYGSLIWDFPYDLPKAKALLYGYHRALCVYSWVYRGTKQNPGLVLGLDRGGCCHGFAYKVPPAQCQIIQDYLWQREMVTKVYIPRKAALYIEGRPQPGLIFVADAKHEQYAGTLPIERQQALIFDAHGQAGDNKTYVENTLTSLQAAGIRDRTLEKVLA